MLKDKTDKNSGGTATLEPADTRDLIEKMCDQTRLSFPKPEFDSFSLTSETGQRMTITRGAHHVQLSLDGHDETFTVSEALSNAAWKQLRPYVTQNSLFFSSPDKQSLAALERGVMHASLHAAFLSDEASPGIAGTILEKALTTCIEKCGVRALKNAAVSADTGADSSAQELKTILAKASGTLGAVETHEWQEARIGSDESIERMRAVVADVRREQASSAGAEWLERALRETEASSSLGTLTAQTEQQRTLLRRPANIRLTVPGPDGSGPLLDVTIHIESRGAGKPLYVDLRNGGEPPGERAESLAHLFKHLEKRSIAALDGQVSSGWRFDVLSALSTPLSK